MGRDFPLASAGPVPDTATAEDRWRRVIEEYGRFLRQTIVRLCPHGMGLQFDDIEQEARLRLWKAVQDERPIADWASYIYRVAATATIDALRRVRARREEPLPGAEEEAEGAGASEPPSAAPAVDETAHRRLLVEKVRGVLGRMDEGRRRVLGLYFRGFTTEETGRLLGWTEPKARNVLYRSLKELRSRLRESGITYEGE
jgi:RNA polymerase sigma-70 factor (ECF subfamily)